MAFVANLVGLVGLQPMHRVAILVWENGDRGRPQFVCGPEGANRNLTAVGYEDLLEHVVLSRLGQA
jgi:hypothetical protein